MKNQAKTNPQPELTIEQVRKRNAENFHRQVLHDAAKAMNPTFTQKNSRL